MSPRVATRPLSGPFTMRHGAKKFMSVYFRPAFNELFNLSSKFLSAISSQKKCGNSKVSGRQSKNSHSHCAWPSAVGVHHQINSSSKGRHMAAPTPSGGEDGRAAASMQKRELETQTAPMTYCTCGIPKSQKSGAACV